MGTLILLRHGASEWNLKNIFTGWIDIPLSEEGRKEAHDAAEKLKTIPIDKAYTSKLKRAKETLDIVLEDLKRRIPIMEDQALNERHYGELQGKSKEETQKLFGEHQVHLWRRSYDMAPPGGESLKNTGERTIPYFEKEMSPELKAGKTILLVAHGNSLRSIIMAIEKLSPEQIIHVNIPTGIPYVYEFDEALNIKNKRIL